MRKLWVGTRVRKDEPGLLSGRGPDDLAPKRRSTGTVMTIRNIGTKFGWAPTAMEFSVSPTTRKLQRLTFDGTGGGLRSDHVYAIFQDREDVVWFGTDRGVCRFDPNAPELKPVGDNSESNFIRTLYQTSDGQFSGRHQSWTFCLRQHASDMESGSGLGGNIIYSLNEDNSGRLLVGSASRILMSGANVPGNQIESHGFYATEASSGSADGIGSIRAITQFRGVDLLRQLRARR